MKDKKNKFIELAQSRVNKAIKSINLIGNLSNKSHYSYNNEQVQALPLVKKFATNVISFR